MTDFIDTHRLLFHDKRNTKIYAQMSEYMRNWAYYLGYHWETPINKDLFERVARQYDEDEKQITINYLYRFIEKKIAFMFGEGFNVQYFDENVENNKKLDLFFDKVWRIWNNKVDICYKIGQSGMICGDAYVMILVDEFDENGNFDSYKAKKIKLDVINPLYCVPEWDSRNPNELIKFEYRIPNYDDDGNYTYPTIITIDKNLIIIKGKDGRESRNPNPYGFVPVIHIQNKTITGSFFGKSEVDEILEINLELNQTISTLSEILDYAGNPITIVKGASTKKIDKKARVWGGLPTNSEVKNLNLDTDLKAHTNYIEILKKSIQEMAAIPPGSMGGIEHISNTSGVALTFQLMPLIEDINMKKPNYIKGLRKLNELILKIGLKKNLIESSVINEMEHPNEIDIYLVSTLPKDELLSVQVEDAKIKAGISTRLNSIKELGNSNPEKLAQEIEIQRYKDMLLRVEEQVKVLEASAKIKPTTTAQDGGSSGDSSGGNKTGNKTSKEDKPVKMAFASGFEPDTGVHKTDMGDIAK